MKLARLIGESWGMPSPFEYSETEEQLTQINDQIDIDMTHKDGWVCYDLYQDNECVKQNVIYTELTTIRKRYETKPSAQATLYYYS